jgi:hypothetical protein
MRKKEIVFTIGPKGEIETAVRGVRGPACGRIADAVKDMGTVVGTARTGEYFERDGVGVTLKGTSRKNMPD